MATNPMQRQARNSFLLGMVVTLLIAGVVVALMYMQIKKLNDQIKADDAAKRKVFVLKQDIKSGQTLTRDMFEQRELKADGVPNNSTSDIDTVIANYSLCDKAGNDIYTDAEGALYMLNGDKKIPVLREDTGRYYTQGNNNSKNYIETAQKALIAKIDLKANTVITSSFIARADDIDTNDVRLQEYNSVVLPIDLLTGDYVDIRLQLPNGQDFIVASKKMVTIPSIAGEMLADTIQIKMAEEEILTMSNAIVEAYKIDGSKLYATKYVEAGMQEASSPTYAVNSEVANLIEADPNIVTEAKNALRSRYNANNGQLMNIRNQYINSALSNNGKEEGVSEKMNQSATSTQESRTKYLQSLTGTVPVQ